MQCRPVTMFAPTSAGGHPEYVRELMTAMAEEAPGRRLRLVTSTLLEPRFRSSRYVIEAVLPTLADRRVSGSLLRWLTDRVLPGRRPESVFLDRMRRTPGHVVHLQEYNPLLLPAHVRALKQAGHRVVITVHNVDPHDPPRRVPLPIYRWWQARAWREADLLLVHSEANASTLQTRLGPVAPPVRVTPHGIWTTSSASQPPDPGRRELLFFGVLRPNKGLEVLLRSLSHLPGFHLTIAGAVPDPDYAHTITDLVAAAPEGQVTWRPGFVQPAEVAALFSASSAVVLPYTQFEAQSGVLHLALAHSRPVAVSDVGGLAETVRRYGCGVVVQANSASSLADGIAKLWQPNRFADAVAGTARAREELSWRSTARRTWEAYNEIADSNLS